MGCGTATNIESPIINLPVPYETANNYLDGFPLFVVNKIKDKFNGNCVSVLGGLNFDGFKKLYSRVNFQQKILKRLYDYFNDHLPKILKFKPFMIKYAILVKCDKEILNKIIYNIYRLQSPLITQQNYLYFTNTQRDLFAFKPTSFQLNQTLTQQQFFKELTQSGFYWKDFQNNVSLIDKDDIPFEAINKQLIENDINELQVNEYYYVISAKWFEKWSFYYQDQNHKIDRLALNSSKLLKKPVNSKIAKRYSRSSVKSLSDPKPHLGDQTILMEQPLEIEFTDIEGQYKGELKEGLRPLEDCHFLNEKLWDMLIKMHHPNQTYKRKAINNHALELYPKSVYLYQANEDGSIDGDSLQIVQVGIKQKLQTLCQDKSVYYFVKSFDEKHWREEKSNQMLVECSTGIRVMVVVVKNRVNFINVNTRKTVSITTLAIGDGVFVFFPYEKKHVEGYVLSIVGRKAKIHYIGYSYLYETYVDIDQLSLSQDEIVKEPKKKSNTIFKGIINIGNTCFINSIIQCLISTPVLDEYLMQQKVDQNNSPLLYNVIEIASKLLKNQQVSPFMLKKSIDINLSAFSGYDQHDAQQFLSLLLDKMNEEQKIKPTIIEQLFGGKIVSKMSCLKCQNIREVNEKFTILSLPIPQSQYNYFSILVIPSSEGCIKKIVIRLHRSSTINTYLNEFENRVKQPRNNFIFTQFSYGCLKKVLYDLMLQSNENKILTDKGITPSNTIYAFEKETLQFYRQLLRNYEQNEFRDYYMEELSSWGIVKIIDRLKDHLQIQFLNFQNQIISKKLPKTEEKKFYKLGNKIATTTNHKIIQRKYNVTLKKYQIFGMQLLLCVPKWCSYYDLVTIIERRISLLRQKQNQSQSIIARKKTFKDQNTIFRVANTSTNKCIFCQKSICIQSIDGKESCSILEKKVPLGWLTSKRNNMMVYVDWKTMDNYSSSFFSKIQIDYLSEKVDSQMSEEKVYLEECLDLFKQSEKVEMKCDKCQHHQQNLQTMIHTLPTILILHMKQFRYSSEGNLIKLDVRLKWQQFLNINKYSVVTKGTIYELFGFVKHSGSSQSGHYTCMTKRKHPVESKRVWVSFDDDLAEMMKEEVTNIDSAYLLFFKKVDMPTSAYVHFNS